MKAYDSMIDARLHIANIKKVATPILKDFQLQIDTHDQSKLEDPERSCYDKMIPLLKETKYGSKEYYAVRKQMEDKGLKHHYEENRHHPEHFEHGILDMTLVDILVMLTDWYAASMRSSSSFEEGFKNNIKRFHISKDLETLLWNTYLYYIRGKVTIND